MTGQRVGYKRVSTVDQTTVRQLDGVQVDKVFEDKASGKDTNRPQLQLCLEFLREGDTLVVHSMDRLARNLHDLRGMVNQLTARGVKVQFMKENLIFTGEDSPMSNLLLSLLGAVAEFQRSLINEASKEGTAIAKAAGKFKGRVRAVKDERLAEMIERLKAGESRSALAREFKISRETLYAYAKREGVRLGSKTLSCQIPDSSAA
jgi:DNA invertase Pin-like site-specific DNA recombinase